MPRTIVNSIAERDASPPALAPPDPRFLAVINAYDSSAPAGLRTTGTGRGARRVRPGGWPLGIGYNFYQPNTKTIVVQLQFAPRWRGLLDGCLAHLDGQPIANGNATLIWKPKRALKTKLPITTPPEMIAQVMDDLIGRTKDCVTKRLNEID